MRWASWAPTLFYRVGLQGRLSVSETQLTLHDGPTGRPPLRIAFASDFHAGPVTSRDLLRHACDALAALRPDVLLLGGDFVAIRAADAEFLAEHLAVPAPCGRFAVLGNHDLRANRRQLLAALEDAGVDLLINRNVRLPAPFDHIWICGLDDPTHGHPDADRAFDGAAGTRVVLMHSPDGLLALGQRDFALALCGHTHGGQIAWPWGRPIHVPEGRLSRRYASGCFDLGEGRTLLVSRGVGCSAVPVRVFAPPEVHLVELRTERRAP
jgi:predicted MPP superfamily phosphohydrolase